MRLSLSVSSVVPSYRSEIGLKRYNQERWPETIDVEGEPLVDGVYDRQACRFSCTFGALWKRRAADAAPSMWLFVRVAIR